MGTIPKLFFNEFKLVVSSDILGDALTAAVVCYWSKIENRIQKTENRKQTI